MTIRSTCYSNKRPETRPTVFRYATDNTRSNRCNRRRLCRWPERLWSYEEKIFLAVFSEMFWIRIPVFVIFFLHLDQRLSPQCSDLPKPFPRSILAHSATVPSYNMALITTSIKLINPSLLCVSFITVMFRVTCSFVFYCALLCFYPLRFLSLYFMYWCIDVFSSTAAMVFNILTYLRPYGSVG